MKARIVFAAASGALLLAVLVPARAANVPIAVYSNYFTPQTSKAVAGDQVTWTWTCGYDSCEGTHRILAYEGASFDSGTRSYPATFTATMPSSSLVKYRCTLHSTLPAGNCNGMCGVLSQDGTRPSASIVRPAPNEVVTGPLGVTVPVTLEGTAGDDVALSSMTLRLYDTIGRPNDHPVACPTCPTSFVDWSKQISLSPGSWIAEMTVVDWAGNVWRSPQVRFFVV